jgi:hypothetical protein
MYRKPKGGSQAKKDFLKDQCNKSFDKKELHPEAKQRFTD